MNVTEKPRSDSRLKNLPEDRQAEISEYSLTHSHVETVQFLQANGIQSNTASVSEFLTWYRFRQQMSHNERVAEHLVAELANARPDLPPERLRQFGQTFFAELALAKQDPRAWALAQQAALQRDKLDFAIQKYQDEKLANAPSQAPGGITPETLLKIENELHLR